MNQIRSTPLDRSNLTPEQMKKLRQVQQQFQPTKQRRCPTCGQVIGVGQKPFKLLPEIPEKLPIKHGIPDYTRPGIRPIPEMPDYTRSTRKSMPVSEESSSDWARKMSQRREEVLKRRKSKGVLQSKDWYK